VIHIINPITTTAVIRQKPLAVRDLLRAEIQVKRHDQTKRSSNESGSTRTAKPRQRAEKRRRIVQEEGHTVVYARDARFRTYSCKKCGPVRMVLFPNTSYYYSTGTCIILARGEKMTKEIHGTVRVADGTRVFSVTG